MVLHLLDTYSRARSFFTKRIKVLIIWVASAHVQWPSVVDLQHRHVVLHAVII